jgi:nucleotide-binding universal stress UspA family protein
MASLQAQTSSAPFQAAVAEAVAQQPPDLVILGWRPTAGFEQPEQILSVGEHHLLLATKPVAHLSKALICLASGEPGKDNVLFAGRLLRHLGAEATLLTVIGENEFGDGSHNRIERFLAGGQSSLARFGVPAQTRIKQGELIASIKEEMAAMAYDLVILGAPLPRDHGRAILGGVIGSILNHIEDCSFLIIRSHQYQRLQQRYRRNI